MNEFQEKLKGKMDEYVHFIYKISKKLPREELYGSISQIRRSAMSVILNYIEGYARFRSLVRLNFLEIAYGSLKESLYLLKFSCDEQYISKNDFTFGSNIGNEIGAMLWTEINSLKK